MLISNQPISDIQFNGLHWIEASAGTGKTYTLSSLLVRVLMEDKMPNEVVATTFTRAATAELKGRIRDRLVETYRFFDKLRLNTTEENISHSKVIAQKDILLSVLLVKFSSRVSYACERAKLIIDHLDDLFIGTLDSFSQKLLKEFSFESGKIESNQITESKPYIEQIIHDSIRNWIGEQPQLVVNLMYSKKKIKDVSNYVRLVQDALSFNSAQFEKKELTTIDVSNIELTISKINIYSLDLLKEYFSLDGCYFNFVNKRSFANENFNIIFTESIVKLIKISTDKK
ncbi:TPA: UvrD-helicase domain-containing protein, partial [Acinetobacter baumannii]